MNEEVLSIECARDSLCTEITQKTFYQTRTFVHISVKNRCIYRHVLYIIKLLQKYKYF